MVVTSGLKCPYSCGSAAGEFCSVFRAGQTNTRHGLVDRIGTIVIVLLFASPVIAELPGAPISWTVPAAMAAVVVAAIVLRRRRLLADAPAPVPVRITPDGFAQRDGVGPVRLRPWWEGRHLRIKRIRDGRYRLLSYPWYSPVTLSGRHVDFEFNASEQTAEQLRQRIDAYRTAATADEKPGRLAADRADLLPKSGSIGYESL